MLLKGKQVKDATLSGDKLIDNTVPWGKVNQTGTMSEINAGDAEVIGAATGLANIAHQHAVNTGAPTTNLGTASTNTEGVSSNLARADHTHAFDMALVGDIASVGTTKAIGSTGKFADAGHVHDIDQNAQQEVLESKYVAYWDQVTNFSASGSSDTVTTEVTGAATVDTEQNAPTGLGILTTGNTPGDTSSTAIQNYKVQLRNNSTGDPIDDGNGGEVYGVLSENAGVWTMNYYKFDGTAYSFASPLAIDFLFAEVFNLFSQPALGPLKSAVFGELTDTLLHTHTLSDVTDVTATATEVNQVTDGVSANVTAANLNTLTGGGEASALHIHDGRYYTETELGSTTPGSEGASLIGVDSTAFTYFTPATADVQASLEAIDAALGNAGLVEDEDFQGESASIGGGDTELGLTLTFTPLAADDVQMSVNGQIQNNGIDYTVNVGTKKVTWKTGASFAIETDDILTFRYQH